MTVKNLSQNVAYTGHCDMSCYYHINMQLAHERKKKTNIYIGYVKVLDLKFVVSFKCFLNVGMKLIVISRGVVKRQFCSACLDSAMVEGAAQIEKKTTAS